VEQRSSAAEGTADTLLLPPQQITSAAAPTTSSVAQHAAALDHVPCPRNDAHHSTSHHNSRLKPLQLVHRSERNEAWQQQNATQTLHTRYPFQQQLHYHQ
jgi:hypothetical protein